MGKFANRLKAAQKQWESAGDGEFADLPEGQYEVQLQTAEVKETKKGGLRASFRFLVTSGDHAGESAFDGVGIDAENPGLMGFLKRKIKAMGYEAPEDISEIEDVLEQIQQDQPSLIVEMVKKGEYLNCNILERIETDDPGAGEAEAEAVAEDQDVPTGEIAVGARVRFDNEGTAVEGTLIAINGDDCDVENEEGVYSPVALSSLELVEADAEAEVEAVPDDLAELAEAHGIEATAEAVAAHRWLSVNLTAKETATVKKYGGKMFTPPAKKAVAPAPAPKAPAKPISKAPAKPVAKPVTKAKGKK